MFKRRLVLGFVTSSLMLLAIGVPGAAAAGVTRVVDDDGKASVSSCGASTTARKTIQSAINASAAGDTVLVCPGKYTERLNITGSRDRLTVRARTPFASIIRRPVDLGAANALVRIAPGADQVTFRGFRLAFRGGEECADGAAAILSHGTRVSIRGNQITTNAQDSFASCGYDDGIVIETAGGDTDPFAGGTVAYNVVRDFRTAGIVVDEANSTLVQGNSVQYLHEDADACPSFGPTARAHTGRPFVNRLGWRSGERSIRPQGGAAPEVCLAFGIIDVGSGRSDFVDNVVRTFDPGDPGPARMMLLGIGKFEDFGANPSSMVGNVAVGSQFNIAGIELDEALIEGNLAGFGEYGIQGGAVFDALIEDNEVRFNAVGISLDEDSEGNLVTDNVALSNGLDCEDLSEGEGTSGTANTWTDNEGNTSDPPGLCEPSDPN